MRRFSGIRGLSVILLTVAVTCAVPLWAGAGDVELGNVRIREGDYAGAAEAYRARLEAYPEDRDARYGLARALAFSGDLAGGEREYRAVLAANPKDAEARIGLADVLAWQKKYREAEEALTPLAAERPDDAEVLLRQGRIALWSGNLATARLRFERVLSLSPGNGEAVQGIAMVEAAIPSTLLRELEAGTSLLRISIANPGNQEWIAYRDKRVRRYVLMGRADYLHRYGRDEGRGTLGATRKWDGGGSLRVEGGLSPGAEIFSRATLEAEAGWPLVERVTGYAGVKYSSYSTATSWNAGAALEYYFVPRSTSVQARYILSRTRFDGGKDSTDGTWLAKVTHFFSDDNRIWAYYSHGSEGYAAGTIDQVVGVSSSTYGAGGRYFPRPRWGIEGNLDWQERQDNVRYITFTVVGYHRF
ncbi:MAG TPA: YaiO family outer membrane beta-barrel protein [Candidatus Lokiarchaeia archaeon]|nr:YaiO family outer membrane beta-barrel protein [Candidatus Lokiarchaeia archaeon]